ncbi:MAG: DUF4124 domain-containing protein [Myxococcaceae bacterium]
MPSGLSALHVVLLLLAGAPAGEQVYTWTDADGVAHYTNDADAIPQRYRDKARTLEGQPAASKEVAAPSPATEEGKSAAPPEPPKPTPPPRERTEETFDESAPPPLSPNEAAGLDEAGWRKRFLRTTERVHRAEVNLARDQEQLKRVANEESYMVVDPYGRVMSAGHATALRMQVAEDERVLNEARDALYDLERLAAQEAIPLEWRR